MFLCSPAFRLSIKTHYLRPIFRTDLLNLLSQRPLGNYRILQEKVQVLSGQVDTAKKHVEEEAKEELYKAYGDRLSAQHQQALEKEVEGLIALALVQEAQSLFDHILSWYRDVHLLLLGGHPDHLANPDFHLEIEQAVQRGDFKPLDQVYRAVEEAYLSLQRSTPLPLCLENLFLKLDRV